MFSIKCRNTTYLRCFYALWLVTSITLVQAASVLTLPVAERQALAADPGIQALQAQSRAFSEQAIASDTWKDPTLSIGTMNLPGNDLDPFNQGMIELKLEQMLPRGGSTGIQRRKVELQGESARVATVDRRLSVLREVRLAWISVWYWQQSLQQLNNDRHLFESLVSVTESMYSQGRKKQQNVLRAEVELSQLDNRILSFQAGLAQSRSVSSLAESA